VIKVAQLREYVDGDGRRLAAVANEAFGDEITRGMQVFDEEYFVKRSGRPGVRLIVAEVDGVAAGFMLMTDATVEAPAQIHLVAVGEGLRGGGIGGRLVGEAVRLAGEGGAGKLKLFTRPWNAAMRAICEAQGFVEEAYLRMEYLGMDLVQYAYFI
jgi:RimJ/RimL family protein N-acetyltransferase